MKNTILIAITIILIGCGNDTHPPQIENEDDTIYDKIEEYDENTAIAPYNFNKFKELLDNSKLQYPDNKAVVKAGEFEGYKSKIFYCDEFSYLHFTIDKNISIPKMRSELRDLREWKSSDLTPHKWYARLKTPKPKNGVASYTWMQIHGTNNTYDFPILRLLWVRNYNGIKNHLWAIIITNEPREPRRVRGGDTGIVNDYSWVDLGERPEDFFTANVDVTDNTMIISINDKVFVHKDISYWSSVINYFKSGVYINRHDDVGKSTVIFEQIISD